MVNRMDGTAGSRSTGRGGALSVLICELVRDRTGGVLSRGVELLSPALHATAALAYRLDGEQLLLVAERTVPKQARPWLTRLPIDGDAWFVAQRAARSRKCLVESFSHAVRDGHAAQPLLAGAGWTTIAAAPLLAGRELRGVLVIASSAVIKPDSEAAALLEATAGILTLALERDVASDDKRDQQRQTSETAELATMGMLSTQHALDTALPLGALTLQIEKQTQALAGLRASIEATDDSTGALKASLLQQLEALTALNADMETGVREAQGSASRLLSFSRHTKAESVDLTRVLERCVSMVRGNLNARGLQLIVRGDDQLLLVDGRAESLQMMLVQLLLYAADTCAQAEVKNGIVRVALHLDGPHHVIAVETNGKATASTRRLFDALVRKERNAVGLGLAKQTVLAHNGHIEIGESELGGLRLSVVLPASATLVEPRGSSAPPSDSLLQPLLVVGGSDELIAAMKTDLKAYRVHAVPTIAAAHRVLAQAKPTPEMILCELELPDGSGTELHAAVSEVLAHRFVFVSGGVMPADAAAYLRRSSCPTLIHPVTAKDVKLLLSDDDVDRAAPTLGARRRPWKDTLPGNITEPPASAPREKTKKRSRDRMANTLCESPRAKASVKPPDEDEQDGTH
jgi:signal transduction histidine kinase